MSQHVIVGAGPIGTATAKLLAERGEDVRVITRRGTGPEHPHVERVAADATDAERLTELAAGAEALYNCANPQYHTWATDWPPLWSSILTATERSWATLVIAAPLYSYGRVSGPMTPETPLAADHPKLRMRGDQWEQALALHRAGRIRATEVRASDYLEANGLLTFGIGASLLNGKRALSPAPLDVKHSWTSVNDVARALVTVAADERAWGRAWMAPTNAPLTIRELADRFVAANGAPKAKMTAMPYAALWAYGLFDKFVKELRITRYQFTSPFVIDSSATTATFGLEPTPMDECLRETAARIREGEKIAAKAN
jgi:nucleoside-diphosphate-sugar epimerase